VAIRGDFWVNGDLLSLGKNGIRLNKSVIIKTDASGKADNKFGICHFDERAFSLAIGSNKEGKCCLSKAGCVFDSNSTEFTGVKVYSGCSLDVKKSTTIELQPKPTPFELSCNISIDIKRAETILKQSIKTIEYFSSNVTFFNNLNDHFYGGMNIVDKSIAIIPFRRKLARFYAETQQTQKALDEYSSINCLQHLHFKKPNLEEGETFLEISKYFFSIGDIERSKKLFREAYVCLDSVLGPPYRLLDFSKNLFKNDEKCFCGSGVYYRSCHMGPSTLSTWNTDKVLPIKITGLREDTAIRLFTLETHKSNPKAYHEEYLDGYKLVFSKKINDVFDFEFKAGREQPMIIQISNYGYITILIEGILRENGLNTEVSH
jgi:hypothetical protein